MEWVNNIEINDEELEQWNHEDINPPPLAWARRFKDKLGTKLQKRVDERLRQEEERQATSLIEPEPISERRPKRHPSRKLKRRQKAN